MEIGKKLGAIEAILFAGGDPVDARRLSQASGVDAATLDPLIKLLNDRYIGCGSGIRVKKLGDAYQMTTADEYAPFVREAFEIKRNTPLTAAAMEVLTVIAYNQPVSKSFIEKVRGVDSSSVVNNLAEKGLIEEAGRLDVPGRPVVYRTTAVFLRCFGLESLADLPAVPGRTEQGIFDDERNDTDMNGKEREE